MEAGIKKVAKDKRVAKGKKEAKVKKEAGANATGREDSPKSAAAVSSTSDPKEGRRALFTHA